MSKIANPYSNYSAETLGYAIEEAYRQLGLGGNPDTLLPMVEQMSQALEQKRKTDFCQHGVFLYGDVSPSCWECEV